MEDKLNRETEKSRIIREKQIEQERTQAEVISDFRDRCIPGLEPILTEILTEDMTRIDDAPTNGLDPNETSEERVARIRNLLRRGDFDTVARYIVVLDECNRETRKGLPISEQILYFSVLLNSYLFDDYVSLYTWGYLFFFNGYYTYWNVLIVLIF